MVIDPQTHEGRPEDRLGGRSVPVSEQPELRPMDLEHGVQRLTGSGLFSAVTAEQDVHDGLGAVVGCNDIRFGGLVVVDDIPELTNRQFFVVPPVETRGSGVHIPRASTTDTEDAIVHRPVLDPPRVLLAQGGAVVVPSQKPVIALHHRLGRRRCEAHAEVTDLNAGIAVVDDRRVVLEARMDIADEPYDRHGNGFRKEEWLT